ncbi:hypothetical protein O181_020603 [Austropuccinia psidii MF-1]|uniref:Reverse transcriptase Ty1/copia-type domain-containing protein n=1 Tax=Austropuccinia psidii MF-1 TaxID=1389203 RepID=A0A9Q3CBR4_9BASI|nr:hypothetical protein [Austropuccinia psidii MF-1]
MHMWFSLKEGINYDDVFSPTGRLTSLQLLLTLCHLNKFKIEQMHIKCVFLNSKPDKDLYILQPDGYNSHQPYQYFILNRSLYGLKQSPRCWHIELKKTLTSIVLTPSLTDPCLFYLKDKHKPMWLFFNFNDLVFGGSWNKEFKTRINQYFEMEDLGQIKYALGIRITQLKDCISLIQDKFIKNILEEFNLTDCCHTTSPLAGSSKSFKHLPTKSIDDPFNYRRVIGLLQYLVQCTRPDLASATYFLFQFLEGPKDIHFIAVKHILAYLNSTKHYDL